MYLTPREKDVVQLVTKGKSNRAIAEELGIGTETVKDYVKRLRMKFDVHSRVEVAVKFLEKRESWLASSRVQSA